MFRRIISRLRAWQRRLAPRSHARLVAGLQNEDMEADLEFWRLCRHDPHIADYVAGAAFDDGARPFVDEPTGPCAPGPAARAATEENVRTVRKKFIARVRAISTPLEAKQFLTNPRHRHNRTSMKFWHDRELISFVAEHYLK